MAFSPARLTDEERAAVDGDLNAIDPSFIVSPSTSLTDRHPQVRFRPT